MSNKKTFPALKIQMGSWEYYSVRMDFAELKRSLVLASSFDEPTLLDDMLQRLHKEARSFTDMTNYLVKREDRFYSSIVVACLDETPEWYPLLPPDDFLQEHNIEKSEDDLGFVSLSMDNRYYVLDGQHRVGSINHVIDEDLGGPGFKDEQISVLIVSNIEDDEAASKIKFRRLFTSLNRYAKPTDGTTNIIMEEDDAFAILTRRMVEEYQHFKTPAGTIARENDRINIKTKSFNKDSLPHFTSLETLYEINKILLQTDQYPELNPADRDTLLTRPEEEIINDYYKSLEGMWDAIFTAFPEVLDDRTKMRSHNAALSEQEYSDHAFLWPLTQQHLFARLFRNLLDDADEKEISYEESLGVLKNMPWDLRKAPWFPIVLSPKDALDPASTKTIAAGNDKNDRVKVVMDIINFLIGYGEYREADINQIKGTAFAFMQEYNDTEKNNWWDEILEFKI